MWRGVVYGAVLAVASCNVTWRAVVPWCGVLWCVPCCAVVWRGVVSHTVPYTLGSNHQHHSCNQG